MKHSCYFYVANHILRLGLRPGKVSCTQSRTATLLGSQLPVTSSSDIHTVPPFLIRATFYAIVECSTETRNRKEHKTTSTILCCIHTSHQELCSPLWCGCPSFSQKIVPQHNPASHKQISTFSKGEGGACACWNAITSALTDKGERSTSHGEMT